MIVADLILNVLGAIQGQFYADRPREFSRDYQALRRALEWWGHECHQRGWDFDAEFVQKDLLTLLNEIKRLNADIKYLPKYLEGAIRKRIGVRAEELSAGSSGTNAEFVQRIFPQLAQEFGGMTLAEAGKGLSAKAQQTLVWISQRRSNPDLTFEQAGAHKMVDVEWAKGAQDHPTEGNS